MHCNMNMPRHPHKFDPARMAYLESDERKAILDPDRLIPRFGVKEGWTVLDIGCGPGLFTFTMANTVGPRGRVYGIDMEPLMIKELEEKRVGKHVTNVTAILSTEDSIPLPDAVADFALMSTVLHELEGAGTIVEAARILKTTGILAVIDWKKKREKIGPPIQHRLSEREAAAMLSAAGFNPGQAMDLGPSLFGFAARKI